MPANSAIGESVNPTLSWGSSANATSFEYCHDTINNGSCDTSWINVGTNTSANLTGLNGHTTYYWQVRSLGNSATTNADGGTWWSFTTTLFADMPPNYWAATWIERLYNAGITGGCSVTPLNYCPESTVTRAQMAVFLLKGRHGSSYTPPAVGASTGFTDVATSYWAAAWIKQLAAEGITGGCGSGNYCPEATVTRAQMAVFLLKSLRRFRRRSTGSVSVCARVVSPGALRLRETSPWELHAPRRTRLPRSRHAGGGPSGEHGRVGGRTGHRGRCAATARSARREDHAPTGRCALHTYRITLRPAPDRTACARGHCARPARCRRCAHDPQAQDHRRRPPRRPSAARAASGVRAAATKARDARAPRLWSWLGRPRAKRPSRLGTAGNQFGTAGIAPARREAPARRPWVAGGPSSRPSTLANASPTSGCSRAKFTVASRNPSLEPQSKRRPSKR